METVVGGASIYGVDHRSSCLATMEYRTAYACDLYDRIYRALDLRPVFVACFITQPLQRIPVYVLDLLPDRAGVRPKKFCGSVVLFQASFLVASLR